VLAESGAQVTVVERFDALLMLTRTSTSPATTTIAAVAAIHSQRGEPGGLGGGGGLPVGYPVPGGQ
jgi:hypothetical protein